MSSSGSGSDDDAAPSAASDWKEVVDKKTGKTYYHNKKTNATQWSKPEELGGKPADKKKKASSSGSGSDDEANGNGGAEDDPKNWTQHEDPKTGKTYYSNKVTKKTVWKKPACLQDESDEDVTPKKKGEKPEWSEATDPKTGKKYWYNRVTKKTTWKDPYAPDAGKKSSSDDDSDDGGKGNGKKADSGSGSDSDDGGKKGAKGGKKGSDSGSDSEGGKKEEPKKAAAKKAKASSDDDDDDGAKLGGRDQESESDDDKEDKGEKDDDQEADQPAAKMPELNDDADGDEGDEDEGGGSHDFKFAKHRKGWINRVFRVGEIHDDSQLLSFKKSLIKKALLKQNRDLDAEAVQAFKNIMSYMGDRKSSKKPVEHAKKMLRNLMVAPSGLRDEVYMQLCKQTTRNPRVASCIKGWELMSYCLATFPPSKHLKGFLMDYVKKACKDAKDEKVVELAEVCAARIPRIIKMGQRKQVPSRMELECLKDVKPVPIRVSLVNDQFKSFNVDPYVLVKEVTDQLLEKYNLVVTKPFALYEAAEANVERILEPKDRILDVQAAWENQAEEESKDKDEKVDKKKLKPKNQFDHKDANKKVVAKAPQFNSFLFKAKLVLKTSNQEVMSDPEAINLIYIQAIHDVVTSRYPCNEKDITVLAALQLQATFGDFKKEVHLPGWLAPKIEEFMPKALLEKKGKKSEKLQKEWEQKILAKYAKVSGFTALEAKLNYLDYVQEWTFYGSTFFSVEQRQFKDYPSPLTLGINCEGVIMMHPEKQTVLENYGFTDIVTWGHSDEKFIIVVGNIVQQKKLIFKTEEGKAMNHLIHDYVKFKVKNK